MPSERSVYLTRRLMPGADTFNSFAAPPMVPVTITARITSTWRSVIMNGNPGWTIVRRDHLTIVVLSSSGKSPSSWASNAETARFASRTRTPLQLRGSACRSLRRGAIGPLLALACQHLACELDDLLLVRRVAHGEKHAVEFQAEH